MFYKTIENNFIIGIGTSAEVVAPCVEISEHEYKHILELVAGKPEDTEKIIYMLNAETMQYEPHDAPEPEPEPENPYGIDDELYFTIIDDYTMELLEGGVIE